MFADFAVDKFQLFRSKAAYLIFDFPLFFFSLALVKNHQFARLMLTTLAPAHSASIESAQACIISRRCST